ncbi:hypothetical protein [Amycolatopsis albispora]|uniref:hypothetical protein n=1 Tax=Amycolatopsis albispora TaxID=1804986 RepID=UPI0013B42975|nr:hypothetical protein [Amycolatopsis albispora]
MNRASRWWHGALVLVRNPAADGRRWRVVRLDALLGILITGLVLPSCWRHRCT